MRWSALRLLASASLALGGGAALAETYTAQIYSVPAGYDKMYVKGAGDNALMSGFVHLGSGPGMAAYRTSTGHKIMHPSGWYSSRILDSWGGTYHCGSGYSNPVAPSHALFWVGGGAAVDIHPPGSEYNMSEALGGNGQQQIGYAGGTIPCEGCGFESQRHAGIWTRTAASFQRLHCATHTNTVAYATEGGQHIGYGTHRTDGSINAVYWPSTASLGRNIRPSGSTFSIGLAIWGNQQGGYYGSPATSHLAHAVIWTGTAASAIDLNPNGVFQSSEVVAIRNGVQVGDAQPISAPSRSQAIAWHGSAATWINLHSRLPMAFWQWSSFAQGIDQNGNIVGHVMNPSGTDVRPVVWLRS